MPIPDPDPLEHIVEIRPQDVPIRLSVLIDLLLTEEEREPFSATLSRRFIRRELERCREALTR